jgi:DNA modification methylase
MANNLAHQKAWPADKVERRPIAKLTPYAKNARTHSDKQVDQIAASIREFGFTVPVLIDPKGEIIAGHGRVMAAERLGLLDLPVMVAKGWSAAQKRAYVIADNKLALNAGWDEEILADELRALGGEGYDLDLTGFDSVELVSFLTGTDGLTDPEETPEPPVDPVTKPGDVWLCGPHRVMCGDSTDADTVTNALNRAKPHLMVTDPPYVVEYDANWRNEADRANGKPYGGRAIGKVENDSRADWSEAWALFPGDVVYVWHAGLHARTVVESLEESGFHMRTQIIWAKQQFAIGRGDYHHQHEPCWYAVRKGKTGHWAGDRKQTTLWEIDKPQKSETGHSTQKPIECMKRPIENNSQPGDWVYEPFLGSGTTLIAGEMTGRKVIGIELSPAYVDVAVQRWQAFTGLSATLEGDGASFADVAKQRSVEIA